MDGNVSDPTPRTMAARRGADEATPAFGDRLRRLRDRRALRQSDLATALHGQFARSTLANIESGREAPSPRLWEALQQAFPDDVPDLEESYAAARRRLPSGREGPSSRKRHTDGSEGSYPFGGPFVIERRDFALIFRESREPEEVMQIIEMRACQDGVSSFVTKMWATRQEGFRANPEMLWGGEIVDAEHVDHDGRTFVMREISFGRALQRGDRHTFALRSWVERMPLPDTGIDISPTYPTTLIALHLAFLGPPPASVWAYGPVADESLSPAEASEPGARPAQRYGEGRYSVTFEHPELGESYGVDWSWT
jgi:transcriptional regulator with XRE-family HTH domain